MVVSFIILALPISVIGANFTQQWILFKEQNNLTLRAASLKPELEQLNRDMDVHNAVLDEMLRFLRERVHNLEQSIAALRAGANDVKAAVAGDEDVSAAAKEQARADKRIVRTDRAGSGILFHGWGFRFFSFFRRRTSRRCCCAVL